jgi:hypothetical protein
MRRTGVMAAYGALDYQRFGDSPMSSETVAAESNLSRHAVAPRTRMANRYFQVMSLVLLAFVLIGFSRTFFLRSLFQVSPIPWYVYLHGSVMAVWFVLLVVQTSLVARHRTDLHRRFGILGAVLAAAVVIVGLTVTLQIPAHFKAGGPPYAGLRLPMPFWIQTMWDNIGTMTLFPVFVATALCMRRRSDVHKRLMLLASMAMITPAAGRIRGFPEVWGFAFSAPISALLLHILPIAVAMLLPLTLVGHDFLTARRLHRATAWGILGIIVVDAGMTVVMPATAVGRALWHALE